MEKLPPLIRQRADPFIHRHPDGTYYFTASVPAYDGIELRRARTIAGLADAETAKVWRKPKTGPMSALIWAPELHFIEGRWFVYFAAAPSRDIKDGLFQHRMYAITTAATDPLAGAWEVAGQIDTGINSFCLDATTFTHRGRRYYVWAQKHPSIPGNSNLYIAPLRTPTALAAPPTLLSIPDLPWEKRGFSVNEGPAVLIRHGRIFLTYSASATDENYCVGLLHAEAGADLLNPASWTKSFSPLFETCVEDEVFGPGHNSFTIAEDGETDLIVYHARTYTEIIGDPLWNPDRHTFVKPITWTADGWPHFGRPSRLD